MLRSRGLMPVMPGVLWLNSKCSRPKLLMSFVKKTSWAVSVITLKFAEFVS